MKGDYQKNLCAEVDHSLDVIVNADGKARRPIGRCVRSSPGPGFVEYSNILKDRRSDTSAFLSRGSRQEAHRHSVYNIGKYFHFRRQPLPGITSMILCIRTPQRNGFDCEGAAGTQDKGVSNEMRKRATRTQTAKLCKLTKYGTKNTNQTRTIGMARMVIQRCQQQQSDGVAYN